jgi:hypothetical protein
LANDRQRQLARLMLEAGADAVVGGHPHVTQDVEIYQGKPIIYSVGNFVMKQSDNSQQRQGWVLRMRLDAQGVRALDTVVAQLDQLTSRAARSSSLDESVQTAQTLQQAPPQRIQQRQEPVKKSWQARHPLRQQLMQTQQLRKQLLRHKQRNLQQQ